MLGCKEEPQQREEELHQLTSHRHQSIAIQNLRENVQGVGVGAALLVELGSGTEVVEVGGGSGAELGGPTWEGMGMVE